MSDESTVERVAKAIAASQGWSWEDVNQPLFLGSARAAIEAIREPTEAMKSAGGFFHIQGAGGVSASDKEIAAREHRAVIEAAMK